MRLLKNRSLAFYVGFVLILTMAIGGAAIGALADGGGGATATIAAGTLTESDTFSPAFPSYQLTGSDHTITVTGGLSLTVTDATGSGAGWNTTISATTFACQSGACFTAHGGPYNLDPTGNPLSLSGMSAACSTTPPVSACTPPSSSGAVGSTVTVTSSASPFYSDAVNTGMGIVNVTSDLNLFIPGNTYAGSYKSTVTLSVVSGPA